MDNTPKRKGKRMFKPLQDRVILKRYEEVDKVGLIFRPETVERDRYVKGTVLKVGPGFHFEGELRKVEVKEGEVVIYDKTNAVELGSRDDKVDVIREHEILCKVIDDEEEQTPEASTV